MTKKTQRSASRKNRKKSDRTAARKRKNLREIKRGGLALLVLGLALASPLIYDSVFYIVAQPQHSIDSGFEYLLDQHSLSPDVYMLLGQAALLNDNQRVQDRMKDINVRSGGIDWMDEETAKLATRKNLQPPAEHVLNGPLPLAEKMRSLDKVSEFEQFTLIRVVRGALLCPEANEEQLQSILARASDPSHGYVLAHQLWAVETMHRRGCISDEQRQRVVPDLIRELARTTGAQTLSRDIHFERLAILAYAGAGAELADTFMPLLLEAQNDNGSWGEDELLIHEYGKQEVTREHATALALYALVAMDAAS